MSDESQSPDAELEAAGRRAMRELPDAPAALIRRAESIAPGGPGLLNRILAILSTDSWSTPVPVLRSGGAPARQLLFTAHTRDIDLRVLPRDDGWTLEGQVLGPADTGALCVRRDGDPVSFADLDSLGAFRIDALPAGRYELVFYFQADRVALPELDLEALDSP